MYDIIKLLHHYIAFAAVILLAWATINGIIGTTSQKIFEEKHRKVNLFALIASHTQLVLGLILLVVSPLAEMAFANMGEAMKNAELRKMIVEHPTSNILAVILVTIGNARVKRAIGNGKKFRQSMIFFGAALLLILSRIPWGTWLG
jgi:hypothetical protein